MSITSNPNRIIVTVLNMILHVYRFHFWIFFAPHFFLLHSYILKMINKTLYTQLHYDSSFSSYVTAEPDY